MSGDMIVTTERGEIFGGGSVVFGPRVVVVEI
jgi:hypothetical protein